MSDRADPWAESTYNGFAGAKELPPPPARRTGPRVSRTLMFGGGVAAAVALGLTLGFAARPNLGQHALQPAPMQPAARSTETLDIVVNAPVAPPPPKAVGRLEVLSPDLARAAPRLVAAAPRIEPQPVSDAGPDCRAAGSAAAQMVCEDPALSRADQRLQRAYARAMRSGIVAPEDLRDEQQDWRALREDAAERSPFALRSLYEQRIEELDAVADDARR